MKVAATRKSRIFPSISAAAVAGMLFALVLQAIRSLEPASPALAATLSMVAFIVLCVPSTISFKSLACRNREGKLVIPLPVGEALREDYLPAWGRIFVWFIALVATRLLITVIGFLF